LPAQGQTRGIKGFILVPQDAIQVSQGTWLVPRHIVRLKAILSQNGMNEGPLVALGHLVKNGRKGGQPRPPVLGEQSPPHTGDGGGVQAAAQQRAHRKGTAQAAAYLKSSFGLPLLRNRLWLVCKLALGWLLTVVS